MAEPKKHAMNPRVGTTAGGGAIGYALSQMLVEAANKMGAGLSDEFQASLGVVMLVAVGAAAGWFTRDRDEQ